jgi:hypothetical protein
MELIRVQSMYTMTPMYKNKYMEKFKRVMRHIKFISMNRRLFWMHSGVHEVGQGAVHVHHDPHVPHGEVQEGHEAHQIYQHEQEVVLDALRSA